MENIKNVQLSALVESKYIHPYRMEYTQSGIEKSWELIRAHNSVSVLIFNQTRKVFVFVKQFRPPVFLTRILENQGGKSTLCLADLGLGHQVEHQGNLGVTLELCAGIVDKNKSLEETAAEEVLEECGYSVSPSRLERIICFANSVGSAGDNHTLFLAQVEDSDRVGDGGGLVEEGELIEVVEMTVAEVKEYMSADRVNSPSGFLFAVTWFLANRMDACR